MEKFIVTLPDKCIPTLLDVAYECGVSPETLLEQVLMRNLEEYGCGVDDTLDSIRRDNVRKLPHTTFAQWCLHNGVIDDAVEVYRAFSLDQDALLEWDSQFDKLYMDYLTEMEETEREYDDKAEAWESIRHYMTTYKRF